MGTNTLACAFAGEGHNSMFFAKHGIFIGVLRQILRFLSTPGKNAEDANGEGVEKNLNMIVYPSFLHYILFICTFKKCQARITLPGYVVLWKEVPLFGNLFY